MLSRSSLPFHAPMNEQGCCAGPAFMGVRQIWDCACFVVYRMEEFSASVFALRGMLHCREDDVGEHGAGKQRHYYITSMTSTRRNIVVALLACAHARTCTSP